MGGGVVTIQAKDIPELEILVAIDAVTAHTGRQTAARWDVEKQLPAYPPKVVLARLRSMVRRGVLSAQCMCGCRGDFSRPEVFDWYPAETAKARARQPQAKGAQ